MQQGAGFTPPGGSWSEPLTFKREKGHRISNTISPKARLHTPRIKPLSSGVELQRSRFYAHTK